MKDAFSQQLRFIVIISIASSISTLGQLLLPLVIGTLSVVNHVNPGILGLLAFFEIGGSALTGFAIAAPLRRFNPALVTGAGAIIAACGNAGSVFVIHHVSWLLAGRLIVGIGVGFNRAGRGALVSGLENPERMFSILGFAPCVVALVGYGLAPWLTSRGGAAGTFAFLAILSALGAALLVGQGRHLNSFTISRRRRKSEPRGASFSGSGLARASASMEHASPISRSLVALFLLISFVLLFADSLLWNFVAVVGTANGIPLADLSVVLMVVAVVCCVAPMISLYIGMRLGMAAPILVPQLALIALSVLAVLTTSTAAFASYMALREAICIFLTLRYAGLAARLDATGGLNSAVASAQSIGAALGPLAGGQMVVLAGGSYLVLGGAASIGAAVSCVLCIPLFLGQGVFRAPGSRSQKCRDGPPVRRSRTQSRR